ncbi:MAG: 30S ribosomal protein S7 [Acidobacteria bacterium]|jgi:small subunit ribosomal protein S7|nr:30S ribosomal protein S7 [Acidobacteriota bacterium]
MPRRREVPERPSPPDPIYGSPVVTKFINSIMKDGKRTTAERIFYEAMEKIQLKTSDDPMKVFRRAIDNVKPVMEVKSRRVGGSNYQVPIEVAPKRRTSLAFRWILQYAKARPERTMIDKLAAELMDAAAERGGAIKKREDVHKMAEANKAFAHYRW